mmetsp:Transcript_19687/g.69683  ORF Transcript_19687/g.69683 Transcript_19687/m.69683 type:complete len:279 (+) Transcript_19687:678-1514(+)
MRIATRGSSWRRWNCSDSVIVVCRKAVDGAAAVAPAPPPPPAGASEPMRSVDADRSAAAARVSLSSTRLPSRYSSALRSAAAASCAAGPMYIQSSFSCAGFASPAASWMRRSSATSRSSRSSFCNSAFRFSSSAAFCSASHACSTFFRLAVCQLFLCRNLSDMAAGRWVTHVGHSCLVCPACRRRRRSVAASQMRSHLRPGVCSGEIPRWIEIIPPTLQPHNVGMAQVNRNGQRGHPDVAGAGRRRRDATTDDPRRPRAPFLDLSAPTSAVDVSTRRC